MAPMGKVVLSAQVDRDVRAVLERRALEADRTLSAEIRRILRESVERDQAARPT